MPPRTRSDRPSVAPSTTLLTVAWLVAAAFLGGCGTGSAAGEGTGADLAGGSDAGAAAVPAGADGGSTAGEGPGQRLPPPGHAWVILRGDTVVAELARTADERAEGLMYRESVPDGTGMLFVFEDAAVRSFWMDNTYVPLDLAYLDPDLTIVDVHQMEPETTELYESAAPAMFALEVRQGWLEERGWEVGDRLEIVFGR